MKKILFIFIITWLSALSGFAQRQSKKSAEVGVFLGGSYYIGDINPVGHFLFTKPAGGAVFRYNLNSRLSARANLLFGSIEGHDSYSDSPSAQQRNLSFKSKLTEFSAQLEFNFLDYKIGNERWKFSPYLFFGIAGFKFNPMGELGNNWIALQPLGTEGQGIVGGPSNKKYKLIQMSIPFGVGIKTNLAKNIGLSLEWGMRKTFTDYLDDVSTRYYDPVKLTAVRGANAAKLADPSLNNDPNYSNVGRQRGNPTNKDWYSFAGVVLTVKLKEPREKCPGVN